MNVNNVLKKQDNKSNHNLLKLLNKLKSNTFEKGKKIDLKYKRY